jgi:membrane associated rhomboid family serine protease
MSPSPAVKVLLIANLALFLLTDVGMRGVGGGTLYQRTLELFALAPDVWKSWFPLVPVWQLLTYGFLHGSGWHLLSNLLFLYFLGTLLEGLIGTRRFVAFYLMALAVAGFLQLMVGMFRPGLILGASGGVLAIVCAMATLQPSMRVIFIIVPLTLKVLAWIYVGLDILGAIQQLKGGGGQVASVAHLAGAAFGYVAARKGWIWRDPVALVEAARERRSQAAEAGERERLDDLLAKISREGISSLTSGEKSFLKKMSRRR